MAELASSFGAFFGAHFLRWQLVSQNQQTRDLFAPEELLSSFGVIRSSSSDDGLPFLNTKSSLIITNKIIEKHTAHLPFSKSLCTPENVTLAISLTRQTLHGWPLFWISMVVVVFIIFAVTRDDYWSTRFFSFFIWSLDPSSSTWSSTFSFLCTHSHALTSYLNRWTPTEVTAAKPNENERTN